MEVAQPPAHDVVALRGVVGEPSDGVGVAVGLLLDLLPPGERLLQLLTASRCNDKDRMLTFLTREEPASSVWVFSAASDDLSDDTRQADSFWLTFEEPAKGVFSI